MKKTVAGLDKCKDHGFPNSLYVVRETDGDDTYFISSTELDEVPDDATIVAIYKRQYVSKLTTTRTLREFSE